MAFHLSIEEQRRKAAAGRKRSDAYGMIALSVVGAVGTALVVLAGRAIF